RGSNEPVITEVSESKNHPLGAIRLAAPRDILVLLLRIAETKESIWLGIANPLILEGENGP
ncbi:MAG TPA: hypothetical protein VN976_22820, partial [Verrucomicrobiae bacterium]|nr:hypothetical protein [Verrucomicrobiae bacterium]